MKNNRLLKSGLILLTFVLTITSCSSDDYDDGYKETQIDYSLIEGTWQQVFQKDSLIFIFENGLARKYIIDRESLSLMERVDYGGYGLYEKRYNDGRIYPLLHIKTGESYKKIGYRLNNDTLKIGYWSLTLTKVSPN